MSRARRRALARLRDALAVIGAAALVASALVYWQGARVLAGFEPRATLALAGFARETLERGAAVASAVTVPVDHGIEPAAVVAAMRARAAAHALVLESLYRDENGPEPGGRARVVEIFGLCDRDRMAQVIALHPDLAAHLPCRIALLRAPDGTAWLATANLGFLVHANRGLEAEPRAAVLDLTDALLDVMMAGATGSAGAAE